MVAQVRCSLLIRGTKTNCDKLRKEMEFEKSIAKDTNHYRMVCTGYFPCDMRQDFSFEDLATKFSVDITYLFSEYSDQLCKYDEYDNLENSLAFNRLSASGTAYGFVKATSAVDDLKILNNFL